MQTVKINVNVQSVKSNVCFAWLLSALLQKQLSVHNTICTIDEVIVSYSLIPNSLAIILSAVSGSLYFRVANLVWVFWCAVWNTDLVVCSVPFVSINYQRVSHLGTCLFSRCVSVTLDTVLCLLCYKSSRFCNCFIMIAHLYHSFHSFFFRFGSKSQSKQFCFRLALGLRPLVAYSKRNSIFWSSL